MAAPASFTARRPNASNLPNFELPPPPLSAFQQKYPSYQGFGSNHPTSTTLTPVGSLLTPPTNSSTDGLSPVSGPTSAGSQGILPPFTPIGGGMWPPPNTHNASYGYQPATTPQQNYGHNRGGLFSPSLNSLVRGNPTPTNAEGLPPPPFEMPQYSSAPMSAPSLTSGAPQHQMIGSAMMGGQNPISTSVSQSSPIPAQDAFARPPPTATYYNHSHSQSATSQQNPYSYSNGPSPVHQSPGHGNGAMKMSSGNGQPLQSPHSQASAYNRQYQYSLPGPVLSNVNNPGGQLQMVGGMPHNMVPGGFNSGHAAAQMQQQMYGHTQAQVQQNDRPFRCDQCPQSFNRNHDLKRHKRIHLAVKPFPCGHCDKSFSRKDALKVCAGHVHKANDDNS